MGKHREYRLGPYHVVEHIEDEVAASNVSAYRWRVTAYDAARVLVDTQWIAPTLNDAQQQLAFAVNYVRYVLTGDTMAFADGQSVRS
jgi:hypothetical protein